MVLPGPDVSKKKGEVEEEIVLPPVTGVGSLFTFIFETNGCVLQIAQKIKHLFSRQGTYSHKMYHSAKFDPLNQCFFFGQHKL
jgi:hypothetical protein